MSREAEKLVKWGVYLSAAILICTVVHILRRGGIGSFAAFEREIGEYIQSALATGAIALWGAWLLDRCRGEG